MFDNLLSAPVLFFILGMIAAGLKSDLKIPDAFAKALSLYLLIAIGLKGGVGLAESGFDSQLIITLAVATATSAIVPLWSYVVLRKRLAPAEAAATAACYGSVSAVTFVIASTFLTRNDIPYSGAMVAAMALMESPAIVVGIILARSGGKKGGKEKESKFTCQQSFRRIRR